MQTLIKHNNFEKLIKLDWSYNVGDIVEFGLTVCNLIIYNIKSVSFHNPTNNYTCILGSEMVSFSSKMKPEYLMGDLVEVIFLDGPRDMGYVEAYNKYLQEKADMELAKNLQNEYDGVDDDNGSFIFTNTNINTNANISLGTLVAAFNLLHHNLIDVSNSESGDDNEENDEDDRISVSVISSLHSLEALGLIQDDVKVTLTKEELDKQRRILYEKYIKTKAYQKNCFKGSTCNICLDDFQDKDNIMILKKCSHYYHVNCIEKWLTENSNKCPVCKKTVSKGCANVKVE